MRKSAGQMVEQLLSLATKGGPKAKRYAKLAKDRARKYRIPLGKAKRGICRSCGAILVPGRNLRVRKARQAVIRTCLECGAKTRYGTGEKLKKRAPQKP